MNLIRSLLTTFVIFLWIQESGWADPPLDYTPKFRTVAGDSGNLEVMYLKKGEDVVLLPVPDDFRVKGESTRLVYENQLASLPRIVLSFVPDPPPVTGREHAEAYFQTLAKKSLAREVANVVVHPTEWDVIDINDWVSAAITIDFEEFNQPMRWYSVLSRFPDGRLLYSGVLSTLEERESARETLMEIIGRYTEMEESKWRERAPDA